MCGQGSRAIPFSMLGILEGAGFEGVGQGRWKERHTDSLELWGDPAFSTPRQTLSTTRPPQHT